MIRGRKKRRPPENGWKETAKRKQVLEGNAFYEIDLECMRKKEKEKRWKSGKEKHGNRNGFAEREFW